MASVAAEMESTGGYIRRAPVGRAVKMWKPSIGDLVLYQGKLYEIGFVYPQSGHETAYHTRWETHGRLRLQDPRTHSGKTNVAADEVELVEIWQWK